MSVLDIAKEHWASRPVCTIEVPEWGKDGVPLVVHFKTPSAADLSKVVKESKGDPIEQAARLVALKAQDAAGARLFSNADVFSLMREVDPAVVSRIAQAIMAEAKIDVEAAEKNSETIHSE